MFVGCLLSVPAPCYCILGDGSPKTIVRAATLRQKLQIKLPSHPVTVNWHRANQSGRWPYNARRLAGKPLEFQFLGHWYDSTRKKSVASGIRTPDLPLWRRTPYPLDQQSSNNNNNNNKNQAKTKQTAAAAVATTTRTTPVSREEAVRLFLLVISLSDQRHS